MAMLTTREVIIYGMREVGAEHIFYVGATFNLALRKGSGYAREVAAKMASVAWEYTVLERCPMSESQAREQWWMDRLKEQGHPLLNKQPATRVVSFTYPGWFQKRLRMSPADAANLDAVAASLGMDHSETVAELCRAELLRRSPKKK